MKRKIESLATGMGFCYATKQIVENELKVGYMYREIPEDLNDSGWRFFVGSETQEYINNPDNIGIYDVNTIANYDRSIIPYLNSSFGIELERVLENNTFRACLNFNVCN